MIPERNHAQPTAMRLYDRQNRRLYVNASERARFLRAACAQPAHKRVFCLTLLYTGCRLSEAMALTIGSLQLEEQILSVRSLKKRDQHHMREIPIPPDLVSALKSLVTTKVTKTMPAAKSENAFTQNNMLLWQSPSGTRIDRITAYRWIKAVMREARITGPQACPKGLRHGYGIHAIRHSVPLNMLQKWMGHASIKTTAIYANAIGAEELELAKRMW